MSTHRKKYSSPPPEAAARRVALWLLLAADATSRPPAEVLLESYGLIVEHEEGVIAKWEDVEARVHGVSDRLELLNTQIQEVSPRWKLDRMALLDLNLLRVGAWEILTGFDEPIVTINECVELAKMYGEKGTPGFVNGLLDQLCKNHDISIT